MKKASIFLTVFLLLFSIFSSTVYAQKNNKSSRKHNVSAKKENTPPKRKIAPSNAIKVQLRAYYEPEKGQVDYATGSYRGDMKLNGGGKTSSGKIPQRGMVATDPRIIPSGTQLYIPKLGLYVTAEDTGGAIKGNKMDFFTGRGHGALKEALNIGSEKKMITVVIIKRAA